MEVELMPGIYPAVVKTYDPDSRTCEIEIQGITAGGKKYPIAEIMYPIGDKSKAKVEELSTEIEILEDDMIWVMFIGGDSRCPVIMGYRNPLIDNSKEWRRYHHKNIELTADEVFRINTKTLEINAETITINSTDNTINASNTNINSAVAITGDSLTHNSKNVGDTHTHSGVQPGSGNTGVPN